MNLSRRGFIQTGSCAVISVAAQFPAVVGNVTVEAGHLPNSTLGPSWCRRAMRWAVDIGRG